MKYRNDIDGLRAIAILAVIFNHLEFSIFKNGYIGVDIFFLISGYLIGMHLINSYNSEKLDFFQFIKKRAKRILPALYITILITIIAYSIISLPSDFIYLTDTAFYSIIILSNYWLLNSIDYFNPLALHNPLIHIWSLSLEEQFYLILPIFFIINKKYRLFNYLYIIILLSILSFTLMLYSSNLNSEFNFYSLPTRFWEFGIGVLTAHAILNKKQNSKNRFDSVLYYIGICSILICLFYIKIDDASWPNYTAIILAISVSLILYNYNYTTNYNPLENKYLVYIGTISYSLYLTHQPIIAISHKLGNQTKSILFYITIIAIIFLFSFLLNKYIEKPFRYSDTFKFKFRIKIFILLFAIILISIFSRYLTNGFEFRLPLNVKKFLNYKNNISPTYKKCLLVRKKVDEFDLKNSCIHGNNSVPEYAIIGDSQASTFAYEIGLQLANKNKSIQEFTLSSCLPIQSLLVKNQTRPLACKEYNDKVLNYLTTNNNIKTIIIHAAWQNYFINQDSINWKGEKHKDDLYAYPHNNAHKDINEFERISYIKQSIITTLNTYSINNKKIIIILSTPRPDFDVINEFSEILWRNKNPPNYLKFDKTKVLEDTKLSNQIIIGAAQSNIFKNNIITIDPSNYLCDTSYCFVVENNKSYYFDGAHLSQEGVKLVLPALQDSLK